MTNEQLRDKIIIRRRLERDSDIIKDLDITSYVFYKVVKEFNIPTISAAQRNLNKALDMVSKESLYAYYIGENHSTKETQDHFGIGALLFKLINIYGLHKDKDLHTKKIKETKASRYGDSNYNNQEKRSRTNTDKYGVDNQFKRPDLFPQIQKKKINLYGSCNNVEKNHRTRVLNSGTLEKSYKDQQIAYQKTCRDRYGVSNMSKLSEVKAQIKASLESTFEDKYGCKNYFELPNAKRSNGSINSKPNLEFKKLLEDNAIAFNQEFMLNGKYYDFKVNDVLIEINPTPTHNINWSPWNSDGIDVFYHQVKSRLAQDNHYRCIHVFDWEDKDKIISILKPKTTIYAKKCIIREISYQDAVTFLQLYHIQGYAKDSIRLGLFYNDELVEVMTFGKPRYSKNYEYELIRLCTKQGLMITGGAEKLFNYFVKTYSPASILSYCDLSKFSGDVYYRLGFKASGKASPSTHWYNIKTKKHITDNLLRQRGFDQLLGKEYGYYGKDVSNEHLMLDHGFVQICDCGQQKFIYK